MCTKAVRCRSVRPESTPNNASRPCWSTMVVTSSAMSNAGSRASAAASARRCSSPPDRLPVSRSASASRPTSLSKRPTSISVPGGKPQTTSSATRGAQNLTFGVLENEGRAALLAQTHRARSLHVARRRLAAGQDQHQRGLPGAIGSRERHVFTDPKVEADLAQGVLAGAGVTEAHLVQPHRNRLDRVFLVLTSVPRLPFVHIGEAAQP